jgi:hypothetical protein
MPNFSQFDPLIWSSVPLLIQCGFYLFDLLRVPPRMHGHGQQHLLAICPPDQWMGGHHQTKVLLAGLDKTNRPLAAGQKMTNRRGQCGKTPCRSALFRRFEANGSIGRPLHDHGFSFPWNGLSLRRSRSADLREEIILRDGEVLHAIQDRPSAGSGSPQRRFRADVLDRREQGAATDIEASQQLGFFAFVHMPLQSV